MQSNAVKDIRRIASKLNIKNPKQRLEAAQQINQLALLLIELRKNQ